MTLGKLTNRIMTSTAVFALLLGSNFASAQASNKDSSSSSKDKQFLHDLGEDSNFEIKTAQLALQKSKSADVKSYAHMVIQDHVQIKQKLKTADQAAGSEPVAPDSMSVADHAKFDELKLMSGDTFDKTYIQGLIKGNEEIQKEEKSEATESSVPAVKMIAERSAQTDTKHAEKAKQLAKAHNITE